MDPTPLIRLRALMQEMGSMLVAYSGGVDSALLMTVARQELGDRAAALTAVSDSLPEGELADAKAYAEKLGIRHILAPSNEMERPGYRENLGDRCFHCKSELFDITTIEAARWGYRWVADGTIVDDLAEHRPGLRAAANHAVRHPLAEAGFTKVFVREAAQALGVPTWAKPSAPCIASRIAVGTQVTPGRLGRIGRAEKSIRALGFQIFRVRVHALGSVELARIEIDLAEWPRVTVPSVRDALLAACKEEGFSWITLDLQGYRKGSVATPDLAIAPNPSTPAIAPVSSSS